MTIQEIITEYKRGCSCGKPGECAECAHGALMAIDKRIKQMNDWIKWTGGECPIKSDKTRVEVEYNDSDREGPSIAGIWRWDWACGGRGGDIIAYRIVDDHEPKGYPKEIEVSTLTSELMRSILKPMTQTREQITAQIEALQKQLDAMPVVNRAYWGANVCSRMAYGATHYFDIETINGVPHIHGVAMKEVDK
jgi:hypothetical protein